MRAEKVQVIMRFEIWSVKHNSLLGLTCYIAPYVELSMLLPGNNFMCKELGTGIRHHGI